MTKQEETPTNIKKYKHYKADGLLYSYLLRAIT
jgi:hypothetical protein